MVLLSLGSNLGQREDNLKTAINALDKLNVIEVKVASQIYETEPIGNIAQPKFMNMAAEIETVLEPLELLKAIKKIEKNMGRKPSERWGPRVIDIDIVLWDNLVIETDLLTIPHPQYRKRAFVLMPMREIAPDAVDPVTGKTVSELIGQNCSNGHQNIMTVLETPAKGTL